MNVTTLTKRVATAVAGVVLAAGTAAAQGPSGTLNINGSFTITNNTLFIDILNVEAANGSTGSFAGIPVGTAGTMQDFAARPTQAPIGTFFQIPSAAPTYVFSLAQVFAGTGTQGDCATLNVTVCTPTGSALNLINLTGGSIASLGFNGMVMGPGGSSPYVGVLSAQFTESYQAVSARLASQGSITTSFSGTLTANVVPEPSTYMLMGTGLLALAGVAVRRRQTNV